ncbi:MAG: MMPL family transporter [Prolixibacteraceae bacterium]|jgi:predicted RND superfamily exporter protein|nr:MMPL family transporter [Prolixibacteraceae bacterium]
MKTIELLLKKRKLLFVIIALISVAFSLKIGKVEMREDEETFISPTDSVLITYREFQKQFESEEGIVVAYESPDIFSIDEIKYLETLHNKLEKLPGVTEVNSLINCENIVGVPSGIEVKPVVDLNAVGGYDAEKAKAASTDNPLVEGVYLSDDYKVTALLISVPGMFTGGSDEIHNQLFEALKQLVNEEKKLNDRDIIIGGDIVTDASVEQMMHADLELLFPLSVVLCALILLLFYRTLATTLVPLIPILLSVLWVIGLKGWTNISMTPVSITLFPLIMVIGMANSVHIINHYKKVRPGESDNYKAMKITLKAVIVPCFSAAITTAIGFGSLMVSNVTGIKQMGAFAAFGVLIAFVLSMIIVPGVLVGASIFKENSVIHNNERMAGFFTRIDFLNKKHTWKVILFFLAITIGSAVFIPAIQVEGSMASFAKEDTKLRNDIRFIDENLSGISSFELIFSGNENSFKNPEILERIEELQREIEKNDNVLKIFGLNTMLKTINRALHADDENYYRIPSTSNEVAQYLFLYEISGGGELFSFVDEKYSKARITIRTKEMPNTEQKKFVAELTDLAGNVNAPEYTVTGFGMLLAHINDSLISTQIESIMLALAIILVMMFFLFGIKGGLLSIFPNVFPIVFFLGLMGIIGIGLNMATSIIAAITIGIVVDDTIHVFYGFKSEKNIGVVNSKAIRNTLIKTGSALATTSLILALGFGILAFSNSKFIMDFGLMSASAIIAALAGDLFISPVVLEKSKLFNSKNK